MKRLLIVLLLSSPVLAEDTLVEQHERTSVLPSARFEIFQSTLAVNVTFKLDKHSGKVWEIVRDTPRSAQTGNILPGQGPFVWQAIPHTGVVKAVATNKVSYQLFTSGIAVRHTYLLNINTGLTWQHVKNKDGNSRWQYVESY